MSAPGGPAFRALCAAAASWLEPARAPSWTGVDWQEVARLGRVHNLGPLLHRLAGDQKLPRQRIPEAVLAGWEAAYYRNLLFNARALELLARLIEAARAEGRAFVVFKGPATVARVYRDPALRVMVDLDLIVRRGDLEPLRRLAGELGFTAAGANHPLHVVASHPGLGLGLELHFALYDFLLRREELLDRLLSERLELEVDGIGLPAAGWELAVLLEVAHLVQDDLLSDLRRWLDLAGVLGAAPAQSGWAALEAALATHGLLPELRLAVEVLEALFGRPPALVPFYRPSGFPAAVRDQVLGRIARLDRGAARPALLELAHRRGIVDRVTYLGRRLLPTGSRWRALKAERSTGAALRSLGRQTRASAVRELARWRASGLASPSGSIRAGVYARNRRRTE